MGKQLIQHIQKKLQEKEAGVLSGTGQAMSSTGKAASWVAARAFWGAAAIPLIAGVMVASLRSPTDKSEKLRRTIAQQNLLLGEMDLSMDKARRRREIEIKKEKELADDKISGRNQRELHI